MVDSVNNGHLLVKIEAAAAAIATGTNVKILSIETLYSKYAIPLPIVCRTPTKKKQVRNFIKTNSSLFSNSHRYQVSQKKIQVSKHRCIWF